MREVERVRSPRRTTRSFVEKRARKALANLALCEAHRTRDAANNLQQTYRNLIDGNLISERPGLFQLRLHMLHMIFWVLSICMKADHSRSSPDRAMQTASEDHERTTVTMVHFRTARNVPMHDLGRPTGPRFWLAAFEITSKLLEHPRPLTYQAS